MTDNSKDPSSFRDPSGYVFRKNGQIFRIVNKSYKNDFDFFNSSGLYKELVKKELLVSHQVLSNNPLKLNREVYKVIKPEIIPYITYPYEWSADMLLSAALLTLDIQKEALKFGMILKDASAFNIQFNGVKPVFIDTLSFSRRSVGKPWIAYRQFCRHFLSPLAIMKFRDIRLGKMLSLFLDGIELSTAVKLLPLKTYLNFHLFIHIFLHNLSQDRLDKGQKVNKNPKYKLTDLNRLIDSLYIAVKSCRQKSKKSYWSGYYHENNYTKKASDSKIEIITLLLRKLRPLCLIDFGSNTGKFSRISAKYSKNVISLDNDPQAVNENYNLSIMEKKENIITLNIDITNPSPALGWLGQERKSFLNRFNSDAALALALIHHLYFSHNLNFDRVAGFFNKITRNLLIEFIPLEDNQVQSLIKSRLEDFSYYNEYNFIKDFTKYFQINGRFKLTDSGRVIFLMKSLK